MSYFINANYVHCQGKWVQRAMTPRNFYSIKKQVKLKQNHWQNKALQKVTQTNHWKNASFGKGDFKGQVRDGTFWSATAEV